MTLKKSRLPTVHGISSFVGASPNGRERKVLESKIRLLLVVALPALVLGCAALAPGSAAPVSGDDEGCRSFFATLDKAVEESGARDASDFPVPGFPYLRSNRFLAAMAGYLENERERNQWLALMRSADLEAREKEIANLPESALEGLEPAAAAGLGGRAEVTARCRSCSNTLLDRDRLRPGFFETLLPRVGVPDEYSTFMRVAGLFPIFSIPVDIVSARVKKKLKARYALNSGDLPVRGSLTAYTPAGESGLDGGRLAEMIEAASNNPLGIPILNEEEERRVALFLAPVFIQDAFGPYDHPGEVAIDSGGQTAVNVLAPVVYYYFSHALPRGRPILQINYVLWYSARAGGPSPRIERGRLDGLTVRLSLDPKGKTFMMDAMNNCGCYHLFAPAREAVLQVKARPFGQETFAPRRFPEIPPGERLGIRIESGWHQIEGLAAVRASDVSGGMPAGSAVHYELVPYGTLESLPTGDGAHRSMFDASGIATGSERIEPLVFFSMGIPSIGSMRQRGHHPIELTGREHFDDPYLFRRYFDPR